MAKKSKGKQLKSLVNIKNAKARIKRAEMKVEKLMSIPRKDRTEKQQYQLVMAREKARKDLKEIAKNEERLLRTKSYNGKIKRERSNDYNESTDAAFRPWERKEMIKRLYESDVMNVAGMDMKINSDKILDKLDEMTALMSSEDSLVIRVGANGKATFIKMDASKIEDSELEL